MNPSHKCLKEDSQQQTEPLRSKYDHKKTKVINLRGTRDKDNNSIEGINVQEQVKRIQNSLYESVKRQKASQQLRINLIQRLKLKNRSIKCLSNEKNIEKNGQQGMNVLKKGQLIKKQKQGRNLSMQNGCSSAIYNFNKVIEEEWRRQNQMVMGLQKIDKISQRKKIQRAILAKKYKMNRSKKQNMVEARRSNTLISNDSDNAIEVELVLRQKQKQFQKLKKLEADPYQKYYLHHCATSFYPSPTKHSPVKQEPHSTKNSPSKDKKISKNQLLMIQNSIQHRLKRRDNSNKNNFVGKINQICRQIKNKQVKLNGYFKLFGDEFKKFLPGVEAKQSQIKKLMTWDLKGFQPKFYSRTQRNSLAIPPLQQLKSQPRQTHPKQSPQIPPTLLTQIQTFYSTSQCQNNKNSFKRSTLNRTKSNVTFINMDGQQLSDRSIKDKLIINNKKMRICNKINELEKQRIHQNYQNKVLPFKLYKEGVCQHLKTGKIVEYF